MFVKILGIFWILLGLFWLLKPESMKNRIQRKMGRKMRWAVYGFIIILGILLLGSIFKAKGIFPKVAAILSLVITAKLLLLLTSKTSEKILGWWKERPVKFFRIWGACILITGVMLVFYG